MDHAVTPRNLVVLHVEDDDSTAYLLELALRKQNLDVNIVRLSNGEDATAFLTRRGTFADALQPDLIVLDLNLPKKNGYDVLVEIRELSALQHIPVIILTSSQLPADRLRALSLGANEYLNKPSSVEGLFGIVERIVKYLPQDLISLLSLRKVVANEGQATEVKIMAKTSLEQQLEKAERRAKEAELLVEKVTNILAYYLQPDSGMTAQAALADLVGLFDTPERKWKS